MLALEAHRKDGLGLPIFAKRLTPLDPTFGIRLAA
jgi:hypothetical protein